MRQTSGCRDELAQEDSAGASRRPRCVPEARAGRLPARTHLTSSQAADRGRVPCHDSSEQLITWAGRRLVKNPDTGQSKGYGFCEFRVSLRFGAHQLTPSQHIMHLSLNFVCCHKGEGHEWALLYPCCVQGQSASALNPFYLEHFVMALAHRMSKLQRVRFATCTTQKSMGACCALPQPSRTLVTAGATKGLGAETETAGAAGVGAVDNGDRRVHTR